MYEGYLHFAGTEIANAARSQAYVENIMPRFGFETCWESADLPCILGDAPYRTPVLDPAPWFNEARPASAKFFGFYPLSVVGVEDSSREVNVTELVQDGAVFSLPRKASKEFRVQGLLMAEDGEGIDVGMSWLRGALEGTDCEDGGDCTGDTFCYMAYLPKCCDFNNPDVFPLVPVDERWTPNSNGSWIEYANGSIVSNSDGVRVSMPCGGDGVQYYVEGLIPGENYRVTVEMAASNAMTLGIGGGASITARRHNEHFPDERNPWVLDFVAKGELETVRVLSGIEGCATVTARIYGIKVERTGEQLSKFLPRFTSDQFTEPASWQPIGTTPAGTNRAVSISGPTSIEELNLLWVNPTGSTVSVPANSGFRRLVRGLTAGEDYILYVKAAHSAGVALTFDILNTTQSNVDLGNSWFAISFTAKTPQHYLDIKTKTSFNLAGSDSEEISLWYIRVDADPQSVYIAPVDQSLPALRSLHNVTLLDGPNIVEQFKKADGAMTSVEFTMAVGEPSIYGELTNVQPTISATTYLIGNTRCQQGYPIRYNWFSNPRLAGSTGSVPNMGIGQHAAVSQAASAVLINAGDADGATPVTYVPWHSARIVPDGSSTNSYMLVGVDEADLKLGHSYTVSAYLSMTHPQVGSLNTYARRIWIPNGGGAVASDQGSNIAGVQRISVTFTYLGGTQQVRFYNGSNAPGDIVYWSYFLFEESGIPGSPFDGDGPTASADPEYTWVKSLTDNSAGVPHASFSKFAEDKPKVITDPTCPPVPVAPQPPGITPDCPRDVTEWRRYWVSVPPELGGGWRESVPVVTLSTSASEVREVRVRFYANPLGTPLGEVDECGACGEFYISYIPKSTIMTIDGIRRTVKANVAGTGDANAMHLASDNDYGPVRWPTMTCDIGYYMTVDIAPDEVLDLDVRLAVAQRE